MNDADLIDDVSSAMNDITADLHASPDLAARGRAISRRRARHRALGAGIPVTVAGGAAAIVLAGTGTAHRHSEALGIASRTSAVHTTDGATARTPLVQLAADVVSQPTSAQTGDATLVVRTTSIDGRPSKDIGGYDLYTDSGQYYYAFGSLAQLQQQVDAHHNLSGSVTQTNKLDAAASAATQTPAQARQTVLGSDPSNGVAITPSNQGGSTTVDQDSSVWIDATQDLAAGAGQPDVRAGAIKALSTITGLTQTRDRLDGIHTLKLDFPKLQEVIWLDADTGVPVQELDDHASQTTFQVERVTAASLPSRISPGARLR